MCSRAAEFGNPSSTYEAALDPSRRLPDLGSRQGVWQSALEILGNVDGLVQQLYYLKSLLQAMFKG